MWMLGIEPISSEGTTRRREGGEIRGEAVEGRGVQGLNMVLKNVQRLVVK